MKTMTITKEEARKFLIHYHGLDDSNTFVGEEGVLKYMKRVGCIQYDPLNVVGRNSDLVLQSRVQGYSASILEKLLYEDRSLIDGWDKMMAIYSREDWPFFHRLRERKDIGIRGTLENRNSIEALELTGEIREILLEQGPMLSSKINLGSAGKGRWGHRKLSSAAMDYMFNVGELGIRAKKNTQKIYDLIENLLPKELLEHPEPFATDREFYKWYVKRRVGSLGLIWGRNGGGWLGHFLSDKKLRLSVLSELVEEKSLITLEVEGLDEVFYIRKEDYGILESLRNSVENSVKVARFLAPLDNLLWDRTMVEKIFDFTYTWEVYVPVVKRKYGYYVLPVLYGNQLVARFEPEKQRGNEPLEIKNWWWEENIPVTEEMKEAVESCLKRFCDYLQADGIQEGSLEKIYANT